MFPVEGDVVTINGEHWTVVGVDVGFGSSPAKYALKNGDRVMIMEESEISNHVNGKTCRYCGVSMSYSRTLCMKCKRHTL